MTNVTMEKLNATNNPEDFGGKLVSEASADGAECWQFGDKFATRWHQASDVLPSTWNGFGISWDDQIPLA
jgi:hypothetical protein